jgi:hypothetical protein
MKHKKTVKKMKLAKKSTKKSAVSQAPAVLDDHCDDYIDDPMVPEVLRAFLAFARAPAHGLLQPQPHPRLFADHAGHRVRVTMASRLGDVGITANLDADMGYDSRVFVSQLANFSEAP